MTSTRTRRPLALRLARGVVRRSAAAVRCVAFWVAVTLPFAYVPAFGYFAGDRLGTVLAAMIALHAVSLVVGHRHNQRDAGADRSDRPAGVSAGPAAGVDRSDRGTGAVAPGGD